MTHYALIFRPTRTVSPAEQEQRVIDILDWVRQVGDMGITLDPRSFGETLASFSSAGGDIVSGNGSDTPTVAAIVFFDSADRDQAVHIARIHPGLRYGVSVELREWTSPRESPEKQ